MWPWKTQSAMLEAQLEKAESRALAAETALAVERRERMNDVRHVISQFLRREKTFPLPKTAEEKAEAKVEADEIKDQPIPLTDVQLAMRDANRREAAKHGISEEDADKDFEKYMTTLME